MSCYVGICISIMLSKIFKVIMKKEVIIMFEGAEAVQEKHRLDSLTMLIVQIAYTCGWLLIILYITFFSIQKGEMHIILVLLALSQEIKRRVT